MKKSKMIISTIIILLLLGALSACGSNEIIENDKLTIITTLFPQYDFAREIVKDKGEVSLLLPPGVEAHSYEPTPQDIVKIRNADVFIYTSEYMEPWAVKMVKDIGSDQLKVVNLSEGLSLIESDDDHDDEHHPEADGKDPHTWLDPVYAEIMVENISDAISEVDPINTEFYNDNAKDYMEKLQVLDKNFKDVFSKTKSDTIIYGGHFAFGYFTQRYGLKHLSPYSGFSPNAEPTPNKIVELIKKLEDLDVKVIYYEELVDPKVANIIAEATGAKIELLHGAHNISKNELESGITYLDIMYENLEKLKEGLGYEE